MNAPATQSYPLQPPAQQPATQRLQDLQGARFVDVRNLANLVYKKPDGSPLLTFQDTLESRQKVFDTIIQHEISAGLITNDLGQQPTQAADGQPQQNGANQMTQPPAPPMAQPPGAPSFTPPTAPPMPQGGPPGMPPPPMAAPQAAPVPAAPATAQQAAQVPGPQPEPPPASGRKRRGAGATVAPPPAAPPAMPQGAPPMQQGFVPPPAPGAQMTAPGQQAFTPPGMGQMMAAPAPGPQAAPQPPQAATAPSTGGGVDLGPVLQRLDSIGSGVQIAANGVEQMQKELAETKQMCLELLAAIHHIYVTNPALAQSAQNAATLDDFRKKHLPQYIGATGPQG